jgi:hypothetical protein
VSQPTEPMGQPGADDAASTPAPAQYTPPTTQQPPYTPASQPQYAPGQAQYGAPQYPSAPQYGAPQYDPNQYGPPQQQKGNGIGIAAIILAVLLWPVGLILGIVALFKGRTKALGVIAIVVAVIFGVINIIIGVAAFKKASDDLNAANNTTTSAPATPASSATTAPPAGGGDPACNTAQAALTKAGHDLQNDATNPSKAIDDLNTAIDEMTQAQNSATNASVKSAIGDLVKDLTSLRDSVKNGKAPSNDSTSKLVDDSAKLGTACAG